MAMPVGRRAALLLAALPVTAAAAPGRTRSVVAAGPARIAVIAEGAGPLVVMLPSRGRDSEDYDAVAAALAARGLRVLRPQPRGTDGSTGPLDNLTLHDLADDVAAVIRAQHDGPAVIVGHAYGNWVARMTAVDHPGLVRGVVLAAAAAKSYPPGLSALVGRAADPSVPEAQRRADLRAAFFAPGHDESPWVGGWWPAASRSQDAAARATPQSAWWAAGGVPLLDLQAGADPFRPASSRAELRDELGARVTVAVIPDASHALLPEAPAAVAAAVADWIGTLPPPR